MAKKKSSAHDTGLLNKLLKDMLLIRRFEETAARSYGLRKIGGFCHLYIGEEAVAVGAINTLDLNTDYVLAGYREHGHALVSGLSPNEVMAELYGKAAGCSKGKGGSMHLFDVDKHFFGGNGIVGAHIPMAAGVALKIKYKDEGGAVLCFFGDGAIHQGSFHETLNMARIWNLPVVFICENNQYGMGTDFRRVSSVDDFSIMGQSYSIPGKQVNGMDVLEVYDTVNEFVEAARNGTPGLLEIRTYRYKGHSMSDPAKYRTKEEVAEFKAQDPIIMLKENMLNNSSLTEDEYAELDKEIKAKCKAAAEFAEESEEPAISSLYEDVLTDRG